MTGPVPAPPVAWKPPFELSNDQGFLGSDDTHCTLGAGGGAQASAWIDDDEVWTSITRQNYLDGSLHGPIGGEVSRNTGSGWQYVTTTRPGYKSIGPYPGSRLAMWRPDMPDNDDPCSLATMDRKTGEVHCELTSSEAEVHDVFGVNDELAYYATSSAVFKVTQAGTPATTVFSVSGFGLVWASADTVVHALFDGTSVVVHTPAGTTTLPPPPVGFVQDIWATSASDIWLAGTAQLRRWDGTAWHVFDADFGANCEWPEVNHLWGAQGRVFAAGNSGFGELTGTGFQAIQTWCDTEADVYGEDRTDIVGIWGMPDGDRVLLALRPGAWGLEATKCMDLILVVYDGHEYRRI